MKRTYLFTWKMLFKYFNCVLHNYINHIHNCNHHWLSYFQLHDNIIIYVMIMANIAQFCGPVEIIVGDWIW